MQLCVTTLSDMHHMSKFSNSLKTPRVWREQGWTFGAGQYITKACFMGVFDHLQHKPFRNYKSNNEFQHALMQSIPPNQQKKVFKGTSQSSDLNPFKNLRWPDLKKSELGLLAMLIDSYPQKTKCCLIKRGLKYLFKGMHICTTI